VFFTKPLIRTILSPCRRCAWAPRWTARTAELRGDFAWLAARTSELLWSSRGSVSHSCCLRNVTFLLPVALELLAVAVSPYGWLMAYYGWLAS